MHKFLCPIKKNTNVVLLVQAMKNFNMAALAFNMHCVTLCTEPGHDTYLTTLNLDNKGV